MCKLYTHKHFISVSNSPKLPNYTLRICAKRRCSGSHRPGCISWYYFLWVRQIPMEEYVAGAILGIPIASYLESWPMFLPWKAGWNSRDRGSSWHAILCSRLKPCYRLTVAVQPSPLWVCITPPPTPFIHLFVFSCKFNWHLLTAFSCKRFTTKKFWAFP